MRVGDDISSAFPGLGRVLICRDGLRAPTGGESGVRAAGCRMCRNPLSRVVLWGTASEVSPRPSMPCARGRTRRVHEAEEEGRVGDRIIRVAPGRSEPVR